ncbi:ORF1ab polyprotein [Anopheles sinensis]|uniref:ORF1ab polyprotein n=1 Tax=Anopheles sinensis TaxID=74873 RepID=A0A084W1R5_ANOSI|nr:ORF1ab polyprotein [Anopheles sinensis]
MLASLRSSMSWKVYMIVCRNDQHPVRPLYIPGCSVSVPRDRSNPYDRTGFPYQRPLPYDEAIPPAQCTTYHGRNVKTTLFPTVVTRSLNGFRGSARAD